MSGKLPEKPDPSPTPQPEPSDEADRNAARWVLGSGGSVVVAVANRPPVEVAREADLPGAPFRLLRVTFKAPEAYTAIDADFAYLRGLARLEEVVVAGCPVGDAALAHLARVPNLRVLQLDGTRVTDDGLPPLLGLKLTRLTLRGSGATNDALWALKKGLPGCQVQPPVFPPVGPSEGLRGLAAPVALAPKHKGPVPSVTFFSDPTVGGGALQVLAGSAVGVDPLDAKTGRPTAEPRRGYDVARLAAGGGHMAFGVTDKGRTKLVVWDYGQARESAVFPFEGATPGRFASLEIGPAGRTVLASLFQGDGGTTAVFDLTTRNKLREVPGRVSCFAREGASAPTILVGDGKALKQVSVADGTVVRTLAKHTEEIWCVACSPDGRFAASGSTSGKHELILWDLAAPDGTPTALEGSAQVRCLAFSPKGRALLSGGDDGRLRLWDVVARKEVAEVPAHTGAVLSVAFSPDGALAVSSAADKTAKVWKLTR